MQQICLHLNYHKEKADKLKQSLPPDLTVKKLKWTTCAGLNCIKTLKIKKKKNEVTKEINVEDKSSETYLWLYINWNEDDPLKMIKRQAEPEAGKISNSWGGQMSPGKGQTELIVKKIVLGKQETSSRFQIFVSMSCQNKSSPECYIQFCHLLLLGPTLYLFTYHLLRASRWREW